MAPARFRLGETAAMPSPFPGMDPWLESTLYFGGLHNRMITYVTASLQTKLPEPYYADSEDRVYIDVEYRIPDVNVIKRDREYVDHDNGGVAVATRSQPIVVEPVPVMYTGETTESFLNIYTRHGDRERLVTSIEILSPSNKASGPGMSAYAQKQREFLAEQVHLVEIDLLRAGKHTTIVPLDLLRKRAIKYDYHVCISRFDRRHEALLYPFLLQDRLPEIVIPLLPGEGGVPLDLQEAMDRAYDAGPYRRRTRYAEDQPDPPLTAEQQIWATEHLATAGVLPKV
jgi:hypothetical protein